MIIIARPSCISNNGKRITIVVREERKLSEFRYGLLGYVVELKRYLSSAFWFHKAKRHPPTLLIVSAPKTGTTSLEASLADAGRPPIKAHFFGPRQKLGRAQRFKGSFIRTQHAINEDKVIQLYQASHRFRFITGVRDPVARWVSTSMQDPEVRGMSVADGLEPFRSFVLRKLSADLEKSGSLDWFRSEFSKPFDLDIDKLCFNLEKDHGLLQGKTITALIYRSDRLDDMWPALSEFAGVKLMPHRKNERQASPAANFYESLAHSIIIPKNLMLEVLSDPLIPVFFTAEEQAAIFDRWTQAGAKF